MKVYRAQYILYKMKKNEKLHENNLRQFLCMKNIIPTCENRE